MLQGTVIKAYNSYYYVQTAQQLIMCTLRGRLKQERFSLLVGDEVMYSLIGGDKGVIESILPRRSLLRRPMVANVDQVVLTFAAVNPHIHPALLDRFLIIAELSRLHIVICINKTDLADPQELNVITHVYETIGYPVLPVSAQHNIGIDRLREAVHGHISVFAGPSGVGKSTLLNTIETGLQLVTGEVSKKIGRGRHTTRFTQLLPLSSGGFVVDTPGFSATECGDMDETELMHCFPEFRSLLPHCKFKSCLHAKEPQCAVKEAVAAGLIAQRRYDMYLEVLSEIKAYKRGCNS